MKYVIEVLIMLCPECHKEIANESKFCRWCGAKISEKRFCRKCGAELEADSMFCEQCGEKVEIHSETPTAREEKSVVTSIPTSTKPQKSSKKKSPAIIVLAVVAVVIIGSAVAWHKGWIKIPHIGSETPLTDSEADSETTDGKKDNLNSNSFEKENSEGGYITYLKDDEIFISDIDTGESWQLTEQLIDRVDTFTEDEGSYGGIYGYDGTIDLCDMIVTDSEYEIAFYIDRAELVMDSLFSGELCARDISAPDGESVEFLKNVSGYFISDDHQLLTVIVNDDTLRLYSFDLNELTETSLAENMSYVTASDDGNTVYYIDNGCLYIKERGKDAEYIDGDGSIIYCITEDGSSIYYQLDDKVYKKEIGTEKKLLASDVEYIEHIDTDSDAVYFDDLNYNLCCAENGNVREADYSEYSDEYGYEYDGLYDEEGNIRIELDGGTVYSKPVGTAPDGYSETVDLYFSDGKEDILIESGIVLDDYNAIWKSPEGVVYYMKNYDGENNVGELWCFKDGSKKMIDYGVSDFLPTAEGSCHCGWNYQPFYDF